MNLKLVSLCIAPLLLSFLPFSASANFGSQLNTEQKQAQIQRSKQAQNAPAASKSAMHLTLQVEKAKEQSGSAQQSKQQSKLAWRSLKTDEVVMPGEVLRYTLKAENHSTKATQDFTVTQPIPRQLAYVLNSVQNRTPAGGIAPDFTATYSIDNGQTFSIRPLIEVEQADGRRLKQPAPPEQYTHIRWQGDRSFPPGATALLSYQLTVR